jgi:purine-binding chemotaxis protein CheW
MTSTNSKFDWDAVRERLAQSQSRIAQGMSVDGDRLNATFRRRAERLAQRGGRSADAAQTTPTLVFQLENESFGIELSRVKQVYPGAAITPVPGAGQWLLGLANLNGALCSIVDLSAVVGARKMKADAGYIVLLHAGGKQLGISVDAIEGVRPVELSRLTEVDAGAGADVVQGTTDDHVLILNVNLLLARAAELKRGDASEL